tara:strand:+ start:1386 stop:2018 length:633 start_codon:yes stop_codon:yes gene_type:complete
VKQSLDQKDEKKMIWKFANQIRKLIPFFTLIVLTTNQLQADIKERCAEASSGESKELCVDTSEMINGINSDFQTVYSIGNVTAISQPPLIIIPKVTIEAPPNLQVITGHKKVTKIERPLRAKVKPNKKLPLFDIVKVLDQKGSMHLGRCLRKLNHKTRETHFSGLRKELETLETLANSSKNEISPIKKLFTQSPSQKDCINYLDFILMAG